MPFRAPVFSLALLAAIVGCGPPEEANTVSDPGSPAPASEKAKGGGGPPGAGGGGGGAPPGTAGPYPAGYPKPPDAIDPAKKPEDKTPKANAPKADAAKLSEDELAELKKLPAAEEALAIKQINCPISGEHLGSMGKPISKSVDGKPVFLCCKGCVEQFDKNPKAALAKLPKN